MEEFEVEAYDIVTAINNLNRDMVIEAMLYSGLKCIRLHRLINNQIQESTVVIDEELDIDWFEEFRKYKGYTND